MRAAHTLHHHLVCLQLTSEQRDLENQLRVEDTVLKERHAKESVGAGGGSGHAADYEILVCGPLKGRHGAARALDAANMLAMNGAPEGLGLQPLPKLPMPTNLYFPHQRPKVLPVGFKS